MFGAHDASTPESTDISSGAAVVKNTEDKAVETGVENEGFKNIHGKRRQERRTRHKRKGCRVSGCSFYAGDPYRR